MKITYEFTLKDCYKDLKERNSKKEIISNIWMNSIPDCGHIFNTLLHTFVPGASKIEKMRYDVVMLATQFFYPRDNKANAHEDIILY